MLAWSVLCGCVGVTNGQWNVHTHTHNQFGILGQKLGVGVLSVVLQDPREQKEENADWRSVGRFWRPMRRQHTSTDIINVLRKCFPGLVLCKTCVWERPSALFWSIHFNTFYILPSFNFWSRRTFEVQHSKISNVKKHDMKSSFPKRDKRQI